MKYKILIPFIGASIFVLGCGNSNEEIQQSLKGTFVYEEISESPLLELSYQGGRVKNHDPTPFIRVFPNGRALIHYPAYMKKAGDYELNLNDDELRQLMDSFADQSMLELKTNDLNVIAAQALAEDDLNINFENTHGITTVVQIRAESFTPQGGNDATLDNVSTELIVEDLAAKAMVIKTSQLFQDFAVGVNMIENLAERGDLRKTNQEIERRKQ